MLLTLALLGQAHAVDVFVDDVTSLNNALDSAPGSGSPADYRVWVLPGTYVLDARAIDGDRLEIRALVPGSVLFRRNESDRIYEIKGSTEILFHGIDFDGEQGRVLFAAADSASTTVEWAHFEDGGGDGGFIYQDTSGTLTLANVRFGTADSTSDGGHVRARDGNVIVRDSIFFDGDANDDGGCLSVIGDANVTITDVQFSACSAGDVGGALYFNSSGTATITGGSFQDNSAQNHGASIWASGTVDMSRSLICRGTSTSASAGGLLWDAGNGDTLTIDDSIFLNNGSDNNNLGGASIRAVGGNNSSSISVDHSTFVGNTAFGNHAVHFNMDNNISRSVTFSHFAYNATALDVVGDQGGGSGTLTDNNLWTNTSHNGFSTARNTTIYPGYADPGGTTCDPADLLPFGASQPLGQPGAFNADGFVDVDGDGYYAPEDCDDTLATGFLINPDATDLCDGIDNDCDLLIDEDAPGGPATFWLDADGDGLGDPTFPLVEACRESAFVADNSLDCDDNDADPGNTGGLFYLDEDGDGYVDESTEMSSCSAPGPEYVQNTMGDFDCDDTPGSGAAINPGAPEICDGIDNNCVNGADDPSEIQYDDYWVDADGDLFGDENDTPTSSCAPIGGSVTNGDDCDDSVTGTAINPDATEVCDGVDNNCQDGIDEASAPSITYADYWIDADGDGFGDDGAASVNECAQPHGFADNNGDCDDTVGSGAAVFPGQDETCDGIDNNCVAGIDEASSPMITYVTYYEDRDGDTWGNDNFTIQSCETSPPTDYTTRGGDCQDRFAVAPLRFPGNPETCDGIDNDCDDIVDQESAPGVDYTDYYRDQDDDGFGDPDTVSRTCDGSIPAGHVADDGDCDDIGPDAVLINPAADEVCDGIDNNCVGGIDEASAPGVTYTEYHRDLDGDGFGDPAFAQATCNGVIPDGYVDNDGDCEDVGGNASIRYPGADEICDDVDNNCVDGVDEASSPHLTYVTYYRDLDGDQRGDPGFQEASCDGTSSPNYIANAGDCDDIGPDASVRWTDRVEDCDTIDNDCDGQVDEDILYQDWYQDLDGDGAGDPNVVTPNVCEEPATGNWVTDDNDCDDTGPDAAQRSPFLTEVCDGIDNDCAHGIDNGLPFTTFFADTDLDLFGDPDVALSTCNGRPTGYVVDSTDCEDADGAINPNAVELCDGIDNNCAGGPDDGLPVIAYFPDLDEDGFGDLSYADVPNELCQDPGVGWSTTADDCQDMPDPSLPRPADQINPDAFEICDGIDNNCDNLLDGDDPAALLGDWWPDVDQDGFGDAGVHPLEACAPEFLVANAFDCDDGDDTINPLALDDECDGVDNNCDEQTDENAPLEPIYLDDDSDGYSLYVNGLPFISDSVQCPDPTEHTVASSEPDCDDADPTLNPGAPDDTCDGIDNDCDGQIDEDAPFIPTAVDGDGDGFFVEGPVEQCPTLPFSGPVDCNDAQSSTYPGSTMLLCDGDGDCSGADDTDEDATLAADCTTTGIVPPPADSGCNCDSASAASSAPVWMLGLLGLLGLRRRSA